MSLIPSRLLLKSLTYTKANIQPTCAGGVESDRIPNTFKEVIGPSKAARWKAASDIEIASLEKHIAFKLVPIISVSEEQKVVGTRWVFKIKADSAYRVRPVVQEVSRILGVDCDGTFAPVCRLQSIRIMLEKAAELVYKMHALGVQTAFLNADVEEDVFLRDDNDKTRAPLVIMLKKSSYDFLQSPDNWFGTMDTEVVVIDFHPLKSDPPCIHLRRQGWLHHPDALHERNFVRQRQQDSAQ